MSGSGKGTPRVNPYQDTVPSGTFSDPVLYPEIIPDLKVSYVRDSGSFTDLTADFEQVYDAQEIRWTTRGVLHVTYSEGAVGGRARFFVTYSLSRQAAIPTGVATASGDFFVAHDMKRIEYEVAESESVGGSSGVFSLEIPMLPDTSRIRIFAKETGVVGTPGRIRIDGAFDNLSAASGQTNLAAP